MNKFSLAGTLLLAVAAVSFAQGKKPQTPAAKPTCAVMASSKVDVTKATKEGMFADYKGRRYFFCCGGCPEAFKKDPAKYAKGYSIPTPKK